jgi:hypothetical protein
MSENMVKVEIDLPDDLIVQLALEANEQDITLNELINNILREYVDREIGKQNNMLVADVEHATANIVRDGVTTETLSKFGYAFSAWNMGYIGDVTASEMIQNGFDIADPPETDMHSELLK